MFVETDITERVAVVTLNDPGRHNTLSIEMFAAFRSALDLIEGEHEGSVIRIRGNGPSFCSGIDLNACDEDVENLKHFLSELSVNARRLRRIKKVVVAEVHGNALAGGCALVSSCDIVCVAPDARLGYPVHQLGLSPAVSIPTLSSAIGSGNARQLMLSNQIIDGTRAYNIGLAHHLAESAEELPNLTNRLCEKLTEKGPQALATTKGWINYLSGYDDDGPFEGSLYGSIQTAETTESKEMLHAFLQRQQKRS